MRQTQMNKIELEHMYNLYLVMIVLILSLPKEGWYLDKFTRTSITYLGF